MQLEFPERLSILRNRAGLKQSEIADSISVAQSTYRGYELGRKLSPELIPALASALGVTYEELFGPIEAIK